ncbi:hypothetical protein IGI37_003572 [Enterococcus sp. AZ194]|uniref:hypothetical protein n=1 Tax=Enterococcus sp. AZ194 TaxID=2774629 RepID=UPI003F249256
MFGNVLKQSNALFFYHTKKILFLLVIMLLIAGTVFPLVNVSDADISSLYFGVFNRYLFGVAVFPLQMLSILLLYNVNLTYICCFQKKTLLFYQTLYNLFFVCTFSLLSWLIVIIPILTFSSNREIVSQDGNLSLFVLGFCKLYITSVFFSLLVMCLFLLFKQQLIGFLASIFLLIGLFYLNVTHYFTLFFSFSLMENQSRACLNMLLLSAASIVLVSSIHMIISNKEFL